MKYLLITLTLLFISVPGTAPAHDEPLMELVPNHLDADPKHCIYQSLFTEQYFSFEKARGWATEQGLCRVFLYKEHFKL